MRRCAKRESALLSAGARIPTMTGHCWDLLDLLIKLKAWSTLQGLGIAPMRLAIDHTTICIQHA